MAAASSRALFSRFTHLSPFQHHQPPPYTHHLLLRPLPPSSTTTTSKKRPLTTVNLISGVDGDRVSDEFVSTRRNVSFDREFSVTANMLKKIEPLDCSVISNGVSDAAKDSMKQTISTMLGLLLSDQFTVTIRVS
ncbi:hypothetical protein HanLR1_Chr03g0111221 [Helianthus annuus]|nr:hypothetical protein HanLR1_Chr03g0111221 [Helianthus annuus]